MYPRSRRDRGCGRPDPPVLQIYRYADSSMGTGATQCPQAPPAVHQDAGTWPPRLTCSTCHEPRARHEAHNGRGNRPGPGLSGPGKYFYVTRVTGPCMRPYNVPNDRALAPSAGGVEYKQQVAGSHRYWPLASLQRAGALVVVCSGQHSRPSALQQLLSLHHTVTTCSGSMSSIV